MNDALGDRMKQYEASSEINLTPLLPTFARVDGRSFHTFTRGMSRPYDKPMALTMIETARFLAFETNACMTYTQSDEITLCWLSEDPKSQIWFGGRHTKMVSQIAALATISFYRQALIYLPDYIDRIPTFDSRVWQVPNKDEGANVFLWRELDATKNSISMAAQSVFSHNQLHKMTGKQKQAMLLEKGINWNDYPEFFKRGTFIQRRKVLRPFTTDEIETLPPKHEARKNLGLIVERSHWKTLEMPPFRKVKNRTDVVFLGAEPITESK